MVFSVFCRYIFQHEDNTLIVIYYHFLSFIAAKIVCLADIYSFFIIRFHLLSFAVMRAVATKCTQPLRYFVVKLLQISYS